VILLIAACAPSPTAYLVLDRASEPSLGGPRAAAAFRAAAAGQGLALRVLVSTDENDAGKQMDAALTDPMTRVVLHLGSVPIDIRPYATGHPAVLFAAYGEPPQDPQGNLLILVPGRADAYREAGRKLAAHLEAAGMDPAQAVGVLAALPTPTASSEIAAFREGLGLPEGETPRYRETRSLTDRAEALRALRELHEEGARYFLLKAYGLTAACLEEVARLSDVAVAEDCGPSGCGNPVSLSVETDWNATLAAIFQSMDESSRSWRVPELGEVWFLDEHTTPSPQLPAQRE
jgi:hypothetical protein